MNWIILGLWRRNEEILIYTMKGAIWATKDRPITEMEGSKHTTTNNKDAAPAASNPSENIQGYDRNGTEFILKLNKKTSALFHNWSQSETCIWLKKHSQTKMRLQSKTLIKRRGEWTRERERGGAVAKGKFKAELSTRTGNKGALWY